MVLLMAFRASLALVLPSSLGMRGVKSCGNDDRLRYNKIVTSKSEADNICAGFHLRIVLAGPAESKE